MPHDVFLSYASPDRAAAEAICAALEARGIRCWVAPRDVPAGADWGEAILTAIGRAHAMVLVLSRSTAGSVHVRNEVVTAVSQSLALVPVRVEDCQPGGALRLHLAGSHWVNAFPAPVDQHADVLAAGVRLALAADATIEIPRAQAAALVAAARASHAAAQGRPVAPPPAAAMARPSPPPAARNASAPVQAASPPVAKAAADPGVPRRRIGMGVAIGVGAAALLVALGISAWLLEPRLRRLLGAAADAPVAIADSAPASAAAAGEPPALAELPPHLAARLVLPAPPAPARTDDGSGARALAPNSSLAGLGGTIALPQAAAPPPVPRFTQAPPVPTPGAARAPDLAPPPPASATRVMNVARDTISRLFVAPAGAGVGREDWLGNAQITPGNAVQIRAPDGQGCVFNIRAVYVGGRTEDRPGVDLCAAPELRFEGGKGAGAVSSR
ncbi:toll/interleukin-1 receptor domain-containing protein [Roseomonas sp. CAU 1739]|uniref:toll/interleukin-1 receptor domain-containing protein n=1 Tax=Roseomonas sp. CAU 1739 TaxID=3140364 RepID=UPI00325B6A50